MLNRLGQSIPPMLVSDQVRRVQRKKLLAVSCAAAMGTCFLLLAGIWLAVGEEVPKWLPFLFLVVYTAFWLCVGLHNLSISLLYGKLVEATSRGRLMLIATTIGSIFAVTCAWFLMRQWLDDEHPNFVMLFLFTGILFLTASITATALVEQPDVTDSDSVKPKTVYQSLSAAVTIFKNDRNFQLLTLVAACFGVSITLFPHYQAYAKQSLNLSISSLVPWVIAQNIGAAAFSILFGKLADSFGNRLALKFAMLLISTIPLLTMLMVNFPTSNPEVGLYFVFFLLGSMPVTIRLFNNYTLEISNRDQQPIYLSTLGAFTALPVVLISTIVGIMVDLVGFESVFAVVGSIVFVGWTLTFRLKEPRLQAGSNIAETVNNDS